MVIKKNTDRSESLMNYMNWDSYPSLADCWGLFFLLFVDWYWHQYPGLRIRGKERNRWSICSPYSVHPNQKNDATNLISFIPQPSKRGFIVSCLISENSLLFESSFLKLPMYRIGVKPYEHIKIIAVAVFPRDHLIHQMLAIFPKGLAQPENPKLRKPPMPRKTFKDGERCENVLDMLWYVI